MGRAIRFLLAAGALAWAPAATGCASPAQPREGLDQLWFAMQPAGFLRSRPAVAGNTVFFGAADGAVIARDVASGSRRWRTMVFGPGEIAGAELLTASDRLIVIGAREVAALGTLSGNVLWRFAAPKDTRSSGESGYLEMTHATIADNTLYLPAWGASLSAVDLATGAARWSWRLPRLASDTASADFRSGAVGAAVSGDTVFVSVWHNRNAAGGKRESMLVALDRHNGAQLWIRTLPLEKEGTSVQAAPIVAGALALVPTIDGFVYAIDRATQAIVWTFRSSGYRYSTQSQPALAGDTLFVDGGDEKVYALRAATGAILWSAAAHASTIDLLATATRVYVSDFSRLTILDKTSGRVVQRWEADATTDGLPTALTANGSRVFATRFAGAWSFREP